MRSAMPQMFLARPAAEQWSRNTKLTQAPLFKFPITGGVQVLGAEALGAMV